MKMIERLRNKWRQVPFGNTRTNSTRLLKLNDAELLEQWRKGFSQSYNIREWFYRKYEGELAGKKVLDVGCGLGYDGIYFASQGANITFADIVPENIRVVRRLCNLKDIRAYYYYLGGDNLAESIEALGKDYDFIMAMGSLHCAPQRIIGPEIRELVKHLKVGGRWLQLAYPKSRWEREGRLPFWLWGRRTDGIRTQWMEWYDPDKLLKLLGDGFELVFYKEWYNNEFNWFDFRKTI